MSDAVVAYGVSSAFVGNVAVVYAGNYLNKLNGERIEYECRQYFSAGCNSLIVSFQETKIVNSIGISILIGIIEAAKESDSKVVFTEVSEQIRSLFEVLGLMRHVTIAESEQEAIVMLLARREF
jgi:anti-anti-sigma factor